MVDAGVSLPYKITDINDLLRDPNFVTSCMLSAMKIKGYVGFDWKSSVIEERTAQGWFFYNFLKRAGWRVVLQANLTGVSKEDFDEICSIVLEKIADGVGEFTPVSNREDGKTWGFEAYLQNYSIKKAIKPCLGIWGSPVGSKKHKTSFVSVNGDELGWEQGNLSALESLYPDQFSSSDHRKGGIYTFDEKKCRNIVFRSVRDALLGHPGAEAYFLHVVRGETIRDTCQALDISRSSCHRLVQEASEKVWAKLNEAVTSS